MMAVVMCVTVMAMVPGRASRAGKRGNREERQNQRNYFGAPRLHGVLSIRPQNRTLFYRGEREKFRALRRCEEVNVACFRYSAPVVLLRDE